jgi:hypothetical protein
MLSTEPLHECFGLEYVSSGCGGAGLGNQQRFASMTRMGKAKVTLRGRFLAEMDTMIPWPRLVGLIEPHYPEAPDKVASRWDWRRCCGFIFCSNGSTFQPSGGRCNLRQRVGAALCAGRTG